LTVALHDCDANNKSPVVNVLFLCIGNSCRSQMAEGFARKYGSDVMSAWSAGLSPAPIVQPLTIEVMLRKNIDIQDQFPKSVHELELNAFDVIVNLSGMPLPASPRAETLVWKVTDPMTQGEDVYLQVRDQIEGLVMQLILQIRRQTKRMALQTPAVAPRLPLPAAVPAAAGPTPVARPPIAPTPVAPTGATGTPQSSSQFRFGRMRRARD
jgi:arsenate reductase